MNTEKERRAIEYLKAFEPKSEPYHLVNERRRIMQDGLKDYKTIAVDFDGTLCENKFPNIGAPKALVVEYVKRQQANGAHIILYTCRENGTRRALLDEAVNWCKEQGIELYAVNENPDNDYGERFGVSGAGCKLYADLYIDDKAVNAADVESVIQRQMYSFD